MFSFLKRLFGISNATPPPQVVQRPVNSPMDEGDIHSGPHGYSPNTGYPESQYGSTFDEGAKWNHDEQ
jgi:hypothetical protein